MKVKNIGELTGILLYRFFCKRARARKPKYVVFLVKPFWSYGKTATVQTFDRTIKVKELAEAYLLTSQNKRFWTLTVMEQAVKSWNVYLQIEG